MDTVFTLKFSKDSVDVYTIKLGQDILKGKTTAEVTALATDSANIVMQGKLRRCIAEKTSEEARLYMLDKLHKEGFPAAEVTVGDKPEPKRKVFDITTCTADELTAELERRKQASA